MTFPSEENQVIPYVGSPNKSFGVVVRSVRDSGLIHKPDNEVQGLERVATAGLDDNVEAAQIL